MKKTSNGEIPFSLTYGTETVIPAEIGMPTHKTSNVNEKTNYQELRLNLDLLDERREIAATREARRNEVSRAANTSKLGPTWEGPYNFIQAFMEGEEIPRTWHACNLRSMTEQRWMARYLHVNRVTPTNLSPMVKLMPLVLR
ncbi:hypothetical protein Tco_0238129, partial [Tanacetum coccineum]